MAANGVECSAFLTKGTVPVVSPIPPFATTGTVPFSAMQLSQAHRGFFESESGHRQNFCRVWQFGHSLRGAFPILSAIKIPRSGSELRSPEGGSSDSEIHHFWHHYLVGFAFAQPNLRTSTQSTNLHEPGTTSSGLLTPGRRLGSQRDLRTRRGSLIGERDPGIGHGEQNGFMRRVAHLSCQQQTFDRVVAILVFRHRPAPRTHLQSGNPAAPWFVPIGAPVLYQRNEIANSGLRGEAADNG